MTKSKWGNPKEFIADVTYEREGGYLYFIDKDGDLSRTRRSTGHYRERHPIEKVAKLGIQKKPGYWYYPDCAGHVVAMQILPSTKRPQNQRELVHRMRKELSEASPRKKKIQGQ